MMPPHPRDPWALRVATGLGSDLRYAVRRLWKERGFASVALVTLALCIGANTAIFSIVYALILRPLPFPAPGRIVQVFNDFPKPGLNGLPCNLTQYADFKANTTAFSAVGLSGGNTVMLGDPGTAQRIRCADCTAEIFDILGIQPLIGRFFTLQDCRPGEDKVVVLTEAFWKSHFNEDPGVLDRTVRIDGAAYKVIGVAPRAFESFDTQARFLRPLSWKPEEINPQMRYSCSLPLYARLKPGAQLSQGFAEVAALEQHFYEKADPFFKGFLDNSGHRISVRLLQVARVAPVRSTLYLLQGGVLFVLLIGCLNVANLLLARANSQQGELAIRAALGAGRGAIARQLLVESLLLAFTGAGLGVGLAFAAIRVTNQFVAKLRPDMLPAAIDARVLACAVAVAVVVGVGMGIVPVVHILRANLAEVLHRSTRSASGGRGVRALSSLLVTVEIAVALVLLCGAGLLIHSFANAISVRPGFDPRNVVVGSVALPSSYQAKDKAASFQRQFLRGMAEIPGVESEALATGIPFKDGLPILAIVLRDSKLPPDAPQPGTFLIGVSFDYFQALRIPLLEGRYFGEPDVAGTRQVWIVDANFEKKFFPGRSAIGGHFSFGDRPEKESDWPVIVGVAGNVPHNGVEERSGNPFAYYPILASQPGGMNFLARTSRPVGDTLAAIREKLRAIDPTIPLFEASTAQQAIDDSFGNRRAVMLLLGGFAALALFLAAIGVYGVLAYDISQRTREIGIRGAIGATRGQIVGQVMRQGLWRTGFGLATGLAGALLLSRSIAGLLFDLKPTDPWAYVAVSLLLAAVAAAACYLPARRAAEIDPIEALRVE